MTASPTPSPPDRHVLVDRSGAMGRITLNRPTALNALTLDMVRDIDAAITDFEADPGVTSIVIDGAGHKGLCAGGDIRAVRTAVLEGHTEDGRTFFREEYRLNRHIARSTTPVVALMDGLVLGGGLGLSGHAAIRVVTERSKVGMPEVAIGFTPDVGGSWLLGRSPGEIGTYAALTAGCLGPTASLAAGLADHAIPSIGIESLLDILASSSPADLADAIAGRSLPEIHEEALDPWVETCFASDSVAQIHQRLVDHADPAANDAAVRLVSGSPTSLVVTLRALRQGHQAPDLESQLDLEFGLACRLIETPDFAEGVRAVLVDKDKQPRWSPAHLAGVAPDDVDALFAPVTFELPSALPLAR